MPISLPSNLTPAYWNKQVGSAEKPAKMAGLLTELKKRVDALPQDLLDLGKIDSAEAAAEREKALRAEWEKAARAVADQCKLVIALADDCAGRFKKDAGSAKQAAPAAAAVSKDAAALSKETSEAGAKALVALKSMSAKLEADAKKAEAEQKKAKGKEEDDEDALSNEKDEKAFKKKIGDLVKGAFRKLKSPESPRAKFRGYVVGKTWGAFIGKANGEAQKKIAMRLAGAASGGKDCKGEMYYDAATKAFVVEGANVPTGAANATALAASLKGIIGYRPKIRLQRPGERGEDSGEGEADPEEAVAKGADSKDKASQDKAVDASKAITARLEALKPHIQKATQGGGDAAKAILGAVKDAAMLAAKQPGLADKKVDEIEKLLANAQKAAQEQAKAQGSGAAGAALAQATQALAAARQAAASGVDQLAKAIETEYANEREQLAQAKQAAARLRALAQGLKADFEKLAGAAAKEANAANREKLMKGARASLQQLKAALSDALWAEIDGNELVPSMKVVAPLREQIAKAETALA